MNFLEELVAEWYDFNGYFIKKNIRIEELPKGGYKGEMDIIAFHPLKKELVHIETSTDAKNWDARKKRLLKKFNTAQNCYQDLFPFEYRNIKRIAIAGWFAKKHSKRASLGEDIELKSLPEFTNEIISALKNYPASKAVPEKYPLLRAIQATIQTIKKYE
ncbi:MAG TPA: hypothetical protein ENI51_04855 [Candidatus Atribacteria bacterium]|nr:hypothetical protein [Candidatus Atribacteria bacterium]